MSGKSVRRRATVGTVLLVVAAVGGVTVLPGQVAADAQDLTVTNEGQTVQPGGNLTFEVTNDVSLDDHTIHVWIDADGDGAYSSDDPKRSLALGNGETGNGTFADIGLDTGSYELMAVENESLNTSEGPETTANFTVDGTPPGMVSAVAYTETGGTQAHGATGETVVEVVFNESISNGDGGSRPQQTDLLVRLTNGTVVAPTVGDGDAGDSLGDRRLPLVLDSGIPPQAVAFVGVNLTASSSVLFTDTAGNPVNPHRLTATVATKTVAESGENTTAFGGERIAIVADQDHEQIKVTTRDGTLLKGGSTGEDSRVAVWDSSNAAPGKRYHVLFDDRDEPDYLLGDDVSVDLADLGLTVTPNSSTVSTNEDLTATVSANATNRSIVATLEKNGARVRARAITIDGTNDVVNFGPQSAGTYSITIEDNETLLTATAGPIQVEGPTPTPTVSPTPTATPTVSPTAAPTPSPTAVPTATATQTATETSGPIVIGPSDGTSTSTPTVSEETSTSANGTSTGTASTPESPDGIGDILGSVWEGMNKAVGALGEAIGKLLSGLFS